MCFHHLLSSLPQRLAFKLILLQTSLRNILPHNLEQLCIKMKSKFPEIQLSLTRFYAPWCFSIQFYFVLFLTAGFHVAWCGRWKTIGQASGRVSVNLLSSPAHTWSSVLPLGYLDALPGHQLSQHQLLPQDPSPERQSHGAPGGDHRQ